MKPILERQFLESVLSNLESKNYNRYQWWRRYQYRNTISEKAPLLNRISHGDLEVSDYLYQAEMELYLLQDKEKELRDADKIHEARQLFHERRRRLQEDFHKEENQLLSDVKRSFAKEFKMKIKDVEGVMENFDGTLIELYHHLKNKLLS
jgi:hypothetical protein